MGVEVGPALRRCSDFAQTIGKKAQSPLRRNRRIELAHTTCRRVARVDKGFFILGTLGDLFALLFIERFEVGTAHVNLAAHLDYDRGGSGKLEWNLLDGADVLRHVFADLAVAARGRLHQHAVLVAQAHGQAVELELGHVFDRRIGLAQAQFLAHAGVEISRPRGFGVGFGANA